LPQRFLLSSRSEYACRHSEILRTNRQIYSEAISVLYSELTMMLELGDLPGLRRRYSKGMGIPKKTPWRHNPLDGSGHRNDDGSHIYNTPTLEGLMDPHVFARFQQVTFHADLEFTAPESLIFIDDDFNVDTDDRARLLTFLRRSGVFKPLVRLLSNSPSLRRLSISPNVEVFPNYNSDLDDSDEERDFKMMGAANERAADIFMNSGILNPLRNLSNVKSFEFLFDMPTYSSGFYQPKPRHVEMIQDLQRVIERNWQVEQDSKQHRPSEDAAKGAEV